MCVPTAEKRTAANTAINHEQHVLKNDYRGIKSKAGASQNDFLPSAVMDGSDETYT